ncbi:MAG TPA: WecB/TagA/CpsF family glycosyltransferase [Candidatus Sulfotelmatobacter sp.]|nr:WecB/TagA/CpsF family glycosyltransferase [Candidatus Sulfotelmatobacter sp.]
MRSLKRFDLLGSPIDIMDVDDLDGVVESAIESGQRKIIGNHNIHSLFLYQRNAAMRAYYEAAHNIHVDGMGVVLLGKLANIPLKRKHRITYLDYFAHLLPMAAQRGWRVFYLGTKPEIVARGVERLRERCKGLQIEYAHGYFDHRPGSEDGKRILQTIANYRPHILLVGIGMPKQEQWVYEHRDQLEANAIFNAGGYMDYIGGAVPTPPRWMGRLGLEWFYRLISEPRRLAARYLVEPWFVIWALLALRRKPESAADRA